MNEFHKHIDKGQFACIAFPGSAAQDEYDIPGNGKKEQDAEGNQKVNHGGGRGAVVPKRTCKDAIQEKQHGIGIQDGSQEPYYFFNRVYFLQMLFEKMR